jgi:hypothetical protein
LKLACLFIELINKSPKTDAIPQIKIIRVSITTSKVFKEFWKIKVIIRELITTDENIPPIVPSKVLLGLIIGNILFLPKTLPAKNAKASVATEIITAIKIKDRSSSYKYKHKIAVTIRIKAKKD